MAYAVKLEQFEGPLDLLLELIEKDKLDVSQVSLANVTDQYLHYVEKHTEIPPAELADFLVVAAKLLLIKSQVLLPYLHMGEEEEELDLESQLKVYREYVEAAKVIEARIGERHFMFSHEKLPNVEIGFAPPKKFSTDQMQAYMLKIIERLEPVVKTPQAVIDRVVSIHEKIGHIRSFLNRAKGGKVSFRKVLAGSESRIEVVVSFLALLELIKQRDIKVSQDDQFDDIVISPL